MVVASMAGNKDIDNLSPMEILLRNAAKSEEELIAIYKDAYIQILERMQYNRVRKLNNRFLNALMTDIRGILTTLASDSEEWINDNTPKLYKTGVGFATSSIKELGVNDANFAKVNMSAIEILSADFFDNLAMGINNSGASLQTTLRQIALKSVQKNLILGKGTSGSAGEMYNDLLSNGLTSLRDRAGHSWNLMTYSSMVIRTKTREIVTAGTVNTMVMAGDKYGGDGLFDLMQVSSHNGSCPICLPYQGKVYSISGDSPNYPKLNKMTPFHPNCRHVLTPFFERLYKGNIDELRNFSNEGGQEDD